ncbi:MAG TPA: hypothetical protein VK466_13975 [Terriglobales bacterium]|nr:hypothetical protein [Terriglobales bacterium]
MRSEKAWVWLAAGVVALGLNGMYQDGQMGWAHSLTCRAEQYADQVAARGLQYVTLAEVVLGRNPESLGRTEAALQRLQTKVVCQRTAMAQRQIAMAQVREQIIQAEVQRKLDLAQAKIDRARMVTIEKAGQLRDCPGFSRVIVSVPDAVNADLSDLPDIQVPEVPEIPQTPEAGRHNPI